jgi:hypothetical protein
MFGNVPAINEAWDAVQSCTLLAGETIETHLTRFNKKVLDLDNRMGVWMCYDVYIRKMRPETQLHLYSVFHDKLRQGERAVGISLSEISREAISLSEVRSIAPRLTTQQLQRSSPFVSELPCEKGTTFSQSPDCASTVPGLSRQTKRSAGVMRDA